MSTSPGILLNRINRYSKLALALREELDGIGLEDGVEQELHDRMQARLTSGGKIIF